MATRKDVSTDAALDKLIAALLTALNKALVKAIVEGGYDPWKALPTDKEKKTLGTVNLLVCTAKAEASYTVTDMRGLSSLVITSMTRETVKDPSPAKTVSDSAPRTVTGTLNVSAKLSKNLSAKVGGKITASCGKAKESVGISGKVTAEGVTGTGKMNFTAEVSRPNCCFTKLSIVKNSFRLNYQDIDVDVDKDLGIFDAVLNPLIDLVNKYFGNKIKGEISKALEDPVLKDTLNGLVPLCTNIEK